MKGQENLLSLYICYTSTMNNDNSKLIVHSATLLKSVARLSTTELKLMLICTTKVRRDAGYDLENRKFEISHEEFSSMLKKNNCYSSMKAAAKRLRGRFISFNETVVDSDGKRWDGGEMNIMSSCRWLENEGVISLTFNDEFMPMLTKLNGKYAKYLTTDIGELDGHYSIVLFGLLRNHLNSESKSKIKRNLLIKMVDLRSFFGLEEKYKAHKDFKKRVLDKAMREINEKTPLNVEYSQIKRGRRIDTISFKVTDKAKALPAKPKASKRILKDIETIKKAFENGHIVKVNSKKIISLSGEYSADFDEVGRRNLYNELKGGATFTIEQKESFL